MEDEQFLCLEEGGGRGGWGGGCGGSGGRGDRTINDRKKEEEDNLGQFTSSNRYLVTVSI